MLTAITDSIGEAAKIIAMLNNMQPMEEWMNLTIAMQDTLVDCWLSDKILKGMTIPLYFLYSGSLQHSSN